MNKIFIRSLVASMVCLSLLYGCSTSNDAYTEQSSSSTATTKNEEAASSSSSIASSSKAANNKNESESASSAIFSVNGVQFTIDLADNDTAAAFAKMLPLKINMSELNGNEKYVYLDSELPANSSNPETIEAGDVMLYGDDCIVVFYKSHHTTYSYTRIGKIEDVSKLAETVGNGSIKAEFTLG